MIKKSVCKEIINELMILDDLDDKIIDKILKKIAKRNNLRNIPNKVEILRVCNEEEKRRLKKYLQTKPSRSISGVSVITVVVKPADCPGKCIYCPRGSNAPQSYTGWEPAIQRGIRNDYDPFLQTKDRLNQYKLTGHSSDKIEVIILGGTFLALKKDYQEWFVRQIFDALNGKENKSLLEAQKMNESADHRCIGMTIETRADYCYEEHIDQMLRLGVTRVEIGVQSIYPDVLERVKRGYEVNSIVKSTKLAKDSGLKVTYHMMPGLFVNLKKDLEQFKIIFSDNRFKPDSLKIYPALVMPDTELYDLWKKDEYKPLTTEKGVKLISEAMKYIPKYCRVIRVQRDIPTDKVADGIKKSNLREFVEKECEKNKVRIQEIRYREVGHKMAKGVIPNPNKIEFCRLDYDASDGKEIFLSFEDIENDVLFGFIRLRIPSRPFRKEIDDETGIIRELHVYGSVVKIGKKKESAWQHKGMGKKLLKEAEIIAKEEFGMKKIVVISGIGARNYYRKFGYEIDGLYVSKNLTSFNMKPTLQNT